MKCENLFEGKLCGAELIPSARFCINCGSKVQIKEEDNISVPCPRCSKLVTKRQRFCAGCGWKIDPSLFESKKIVCSGTNEDGTLCGEELSPDMKFCAACGTVQSKHEDGTEPKPEGGQDKSDLKIGPVMNEQLTVPTNVTETAGSSSSSDSPDTWKPPSTLTSTPESNEGESERQQEKTQDQDRNPSGGKILILRPHQESITDSDEIVDLTSPNGQTSPAMVSPTSTIPSNSTTSATAMGDSVQTTLYTKPSQDDQPLASTQDQTSDGPWPALAISADSVNNNPEQVGTDTSYMEKEHMSDKSGTGGSETISIESPSTFSMVFGAGVIRPHRDGWTEQEGHTQLPQQCTETNEMPGIHHSDVPSSNMKPEGETSNVKNLTLRFENINNGRHQGDNNSNPQLKREISQSSADEDEEEMSSGDEEEEEEGEDDNNDNIETPISGQDEKKSANKAGKKKAGLTKREQRRMKKKERKERSKRRRLHIPENELEASSKISSPITRKREATLAAKGDQRPEKKDPKPETVDKTKGKKTEDTSKQNNTDSEKGLNNQQNDYTKPSELTANMGKDVKTEMKEKLNITRDTTAPGNTATQGKNQQTGDTKPTEQTANKGKNVKTETKEKPYNTRSTTTGNTTQKSKDNKNNQTEKHSSTAASNKPEVNNGNERRNKEFAEVYYHVIVSPTILASIDKGIVIVRFHSDTLGGWKSHKHKLSYKRTVSDGYYEYQGKVNIPKHILWKPVFYVYSVVQSDEKIVDEHVYSHTSERNHRSMYLGPNKVPDIIHRYDGVIREKPVKEKGFFKTIKGIFTGDEYVKRLQSDASLAFKTFLPPVQLKMNDSNGMVGEDIIYHIDWIYFGLVDMYQMVAGLWRTSRDFFSSMIKHLEKYISSNLTKLSESRQGKVTDEDRVLHLCAAVTLNHLKEGNGIQISKPETRKLCEAFLPQLDDKKQECIEFKSLGNYFTTTRKLMVDNLLKMIRDLAKDGTDPCWMFCMPVLHYMRGMYQPYEPVPLNSNHDETSAEWWGISEIRYEVRCFQAKDKWDSSRTEVLEILSPYFELDYFLPRVFVASLRSLHMSGSGINLTLIPPEVTLAAACFYIKTYFVSREVLQDLKKMFGVVSSQLVTFVSDKRWSVKKAWKCLKIGSDVLDQCYLKNVDRNVLYMMAGEPFFIAVDWFTKSLQIRQDEGKMGTYDQHLNYFQKHRDRIKNILKNELYHGYEVDFLISWNTALTFRIPDGNTKDSYLSMIMSSLQFELKSRSAASEVKLIEIYCDNLELFCDSMQEVLGKFAFEAVEKCSNLYFNTSREGAALMRFGILLSRAFERSFDLKQLDNEHNILQYTLSWAPFSTFLKLYYTKDYAKSLRDFSVDLMKNFVLVLQDVSKCLIDGTILVQDLKIIQEKSDHFKSVVSEIKDLPVKAELAVTAVKLRSKELKAYSTTLQTVQSFVYICTNCQGDTRIVEEKIKKFEKMETIILNELCRPVVVDEVKDIEQYQPIVTAFGLEHDVLEILPKILECSDSVLFMKLWEKRGNEMAKQKDRKLNLEEILTELWEPTYKFWSSLCEKLRAGNLLFSEFEKFFPTANIENLKNELTLLCQGGESTWVDKRIDQIQKYRNLRSCYFGANAIMEVVREYELTGDFSQIIDIIELTKGADTKMNTLDDKLMNTCSILRNVDEEKANCLRMFITCKPLVEWLKQTMPNGLKDFKVFVELASISAGEGDYEIGRVNCLHSATTGYASLIFNLNPECNAKIFLEKCEEVWKELVSNPYLPTKLCDTNRHLEWLKIVKQSHGSVEVTSLAQAEAINTNGIYQVGNLQKAMNIKNPTLSDVMELRVTESEGQRLQRNQYKYEQLHDLQSRLMLVAGKAEKGKDDVDRFMLILDSIVRLGNIYTKLVAEGCVLFSQWHVKFLCDKARYACAFIKFGFGVEKHTLKGRTDDENKDVSAIIPKIAKFMEQCHRKWLDYIDSKREKYYLLNFFTVDQMVILQQELVKVGSNVEPSLLIYPLLSAVKHGCTKEDLVKAMASAKSDVDNLDLLRDQNMEDDEEQTDMETENVEESVKINKFLEVLTKSYPVELAREALKHVSPDDIDDGLVWCMDNEEDFIPTEEESQAAFHIEQPEKEVTFTGWTENDQSLASFTASLVSQLGVETKDNSVDKLIKALEDLWETFLNSISSSVSDYLSVEHLGLILNRLAEQEQFKIDRTFLLSFQPGEPNLIICPQSEIYNTVLSVYSHESDKPLPQSDEVLMCTPYTTLDMVEIFWRRSLFADNNRVHCLVNADLLDYEVSDRGERTLERLMKNAESQEIKYKLVVICSSENEYKSRMVAALDKYHRPQLPIDVHNVQKYLLTKLQVERSNTGVRPASSVDFEKCSVRVVKSWRAGVGKSLYKKRMVADLYKLDPNIPRRMSSNVTIPLHEKTINIDDIMDILLEETLPPRCHEPRIFHIDISHEVQVGVDAFLFQLLILGCLGHSSGHVWRKSEMDYYIIESMPLLAKTTDVQGGKLKCLHHCLDILPHVMCRSPQESLEILNDSKKPQDYSDHDRLFDSIEFKSTTFQRPYQYLKRLDTNCRLDDVKPNIPESDKKQCLFTLLRHCGIRDPSWSELHHFVSFLNKQLQDFEVSAFCGLAAVEDLPGFAKFVLRFLIQMSRDFSTRSLKVSEESPVQLLERQVMEDEEEEDEETDKVIQLYQMRRTWETSPHPYLFFNPDHHSMTFLGFNIDRRTGNLIDLQTREILENGIMQQNLFDALIRNKVNLSENFDALPRHEKIMKLCNVMGLDMAHDPDETYELTTDNVKKILAIYMRFRCEIPVIIMGETGCGKTRLVKFMCSLQQPPGVNVENMILMKVHGGTKPSDIVRKVRKAEEMARKNAAEYPFMDTVLFFDEANTTEAIGVIKEIMCDNSLGGKPIQLHEKLKIVAACNPYRKHSEELIKRLEQAGLGYHVDADKTTDRLGRVPMRRLVYRVQPLPQSMLPLVWDFGQLNTEVEEMYIKQMVLRYVKNEQLPDLQGLETVVSKILTVSQDFMRQQKDECSFVSLRDVERVLQVMSWFLKQSEEGANLLFQKMREDLDDSKAESEDESMDEEQPQLQMDDVTRSLVLALGVCYHACLKNRAEYRDTVARYFTPPLQLPGGPAQIDEEITRCQTVFLENVELADNIAKNQALKENVFMMIVCIELRIPMFLVGKPGSSKSLAKTIVSDAMQGNAAHKDLFKRYKQAQMVSFQCSPLSVPGGIVGTFRQCAAYQKDKNLDTFVSIVVLDEIGLAEDSPRMPLKTLHPLLEDGCPDDEDPEPYKKVAFIGISNWALDPAKMNRGILVQREVPDITELRESAEGICSTDKGVLKLIKPMIEPMADSYLELFEEASTEMREFFGLRDFYSLLKMLYAFVSLSRSKPTWLQLKHSILRNFGGLENVDPVDIFYSKLSRLVNKHEQPNDDDPVCTSAGMIQTCLSWDESNSESRYLLLLTENYGALTILQQNLFTMHNAVVIFGSSFPSDQEYTQVCRNINRIKVCMETGSTVILLNLENLYESLYDALNQYYVKLGEERYVDLGLGTQRVKCRVHKKFRLIVVAEKQIVYNNFPIPLINRLEKHFLSLKTMLTLNQLQLTEKLQKWAQEFCEAKTPPYMRKKKDIRKIGDAFMGYHADTCAAIILHVCQEKRCDDEAIPQIEKEICHEAQTILLWCATPAAVWQLEDKQVFHTYFTEQHHDSLADYLHYKMMTEQQGNILAQITTNSKLLSTADLDSLCHFIPVRRDNVTLLTLQSFDTEQQFSRQIKSCLEHSIDAHMLLIVQCDCGDQNADLIACARYTVQGELQQAQEDREFDIHVVFLIQLPGIAGGCFSGFQCGSWHSVHIDDVHPARDEIPSVAAMHGKSVSDLLSSTMGRSLGVTMDMEEGLKGEEEKMDTDERVVDLMDIEIQEKDSDKIYEPKGQFHIDYLIRKCVQPALGNVKDPVSDHSRAIDRLKIILNSLQNDTGDLTVLSGIGKHLTSILREKEQSSASVLTNWLSTEASKPENINRAGTFRRFAVQCLESRIIPLLAGIIAFIDTNRNLDILTSKEEWKVDLWLQIFNDPELTQLKYSLIVSPSRQQELQEIAVKFTSVDGKIFSAVTPFSWLIFRQIDEVLRNFLNKAKQDGDDDFTVVMKTADILQALPLGKLLSSIEGTSIHQILKSYIVDFVHMVHPVQSEAECNLVCESVMTGCKQLIRGEYGRLLPSLLGYHLTYIMYDARFKNFSHIVNVWPDCSTKTVEFQQEQSNFYLVTDEEMTLDILALHMLVDHLEPSKEGLNKQDTRMKWLRQVCDYRPIVERIFGHYYQDMENQEYQYGEKCKRGIQQARYQWTRAIVVKLFIEHVCTAGKVEIYITRCMPLWQTLREGADMKDIKSLEKVEKFLKHCHKDIIAQCFGTQAKCVSCDSPIEGAPVRLPCDHIICRKCFNDCITLQEYKCPLCEEDFPQDLNPDNSQNVGEIKKYQDYRKRCNSFFMEVVSQLCFSDSTPPSTEVIEKLLSYIFCHTKTKRVERVVSRELTIFDDTIDPTPVVRSFLLQQLMQTSGHEIEHHLIEYFRRAGQLVGAGQNNQWIELCQLVLQCMEDSHHQHANKDDEVSMATRMLRDAASYMTDDIEVLERIDYISKARFSLSVVAKYIHNLYCRTQKSMPEPKIRKIFDAAARLCEECGSQWPRRFFVKQLCRNYGIDSYQTVVVKKEVSFLRWICLPELKENKVKECHDRYIVNGDEYKTLRETVVTTVLNENSERLAQLLKAPKNDWQSRVRLLLALHREITMNIVYGGDPQKFTDKGKAFLKDFLMNCTLVRNKEFAQGILDNSLWRLEGNIAPGMDLAQQNMYCLLTHYLVLMTEIPGKTTLLTPLQNIALQPQNMIRSFFPTMPQDEMSEIREAVLAARAQNPNENPVFYRCPNGHPYIIGNCGRAAYIGTCRACGQEIGGLGYRLRPGNIQDAGVDRTETGHFIGRATRLEPITATERKLSRSSVAVLRLLTHLSMYIGANNNSQALCQSIKPNIEEEDLAAYLLEHIELDLTSIQNILGKNKDDVLVLIHYLLAQIMNEHTMAVIGENYPANVCGLLDKNARTKWEEDFSKKYIDPLLQESQNIIGHFNDRILNDHRLGADPLLQILYETDKPEEIHDMLALHEIPAVWRYRALISVDHLRQNIGSTNLKIPLLRLFLKEEHHLRAIRFVPSIMRLQKMLIQKYSRKLDRAEATALTIKKVKQQMSEERRLKEFELSLEDFTQAWNCVRESLETYVCPANENLVTVDKEYCRSDINEHTPISYLIPTHKDAGLCSYVLLFFLLQKQNLFLEKYCQECKKRESSLPKVPVKDISAAHLISYHPDKDLLPMVLANCNYSFEVGQGTTIEYNVTNIEKQLMDRFLFSKSVIQDIHEIETITYRSESTNAVVFKSLYSRIKQERLAPAVQGQIYEELRLKSYPDLCESLDKLDIAISFLKSVGSDPESSLHRFMTNTLNLDNPFPSQMAQQISKCKNTMSLWITFALERARTLAKYEKKAFSAIYASSVQITPKYVEDRNFQSLCMNESKQTRSSETVKITFALERARTLAKYEKKAFEGISDNFKKPLTDGQTAALRDILNKIPVEHIDILSELMFECIVIKIDVPQNKDDEDYVDMSKISLHDALFGYLDTSPYEEELQFDDFLKMVISQLPSDVEDPLRILTGQSVEVWNLIHKIFTEKQRQRH